MDAIETIKTRRSVRKYIDKKIDDDTIKKLLESAVSAPSAGNQQPWHFIVIDDEDIIRKIPDFHPNAKFVIDADKIILVCGDLNLEKFKGYWMIDCSAATQNILLAARALDLGSCWIGIFPRNERIKILKEIFNLPRNIIPFSIISLGYTDEKQEMVNRIKESKFHYNKW